MGPGWLCRIATAKNGSGLATDGWSALPIDSTSASRAGAVKKILRRDFLVLDIFGSRLRARKGPALATLGVGGVDGISVSFLIDFHM